MDVRIIERANTVSNDYEVVELVDAVDENNKAVKIKRVTKTINSVRLDRDIIQVTERLNELTEIKTKIEALDK